MTHQRVGDFGSDGYESFNQNQTMRVFVIFQSYATEHRKRAQQRALQRALQRAQQRASQWAPQRLAYCLLEFFQLLPLSFCTSG